MTDQPHLKVMARLIRWNDDIDIDLASRNEVDQLDSLFNSRYGYDSSMPELNSETPPREQISTALARVLRKYDTLDGRHLLIIHYSGHGKATQPAGLELPAAMELDLLRTRISWPAVEQNLSTTSNILLVLDCCCATAVIE